MAQENIRNFVIIAHIDHGKSTLADRLLELTGTVQPKKMQEQFLDSMELEREKGITIKLKPVRMDCVLNNKSYVLNLVDTPGHVDFSYEVSRALAAVEGAVLLVDATQGVQAQTLANIELAKKSRFHGNMEISPVSEQGFVIIPVINKIDSPQAMIEESVKELAGVLNISPELVLKISAKTGSNVEQVLSAVIEKIPPPMKSGLIDNLGKGQFRALIFDSDYDLFKGVIAFVRIVDGSIKKGEKIELMATKTKAEIKELGIFSPSMSPKEILSEGEIGYIATGIKEPGKVRVGDTVTKIQDTRNNNQIEPLAGYEEPLPMVFASFYPENPDDFDLLKTALSKLKLSDPALVYEPEMKEALGRGFRCGFLGTLHVEIVSERLEREFGLGLVISTPSVVYKIFDKKGQEKFVYSASDWPDPSTIEKMEEPWVLLEVVAPSVYLGRLMDVLKSLKGNYLKTDYLTAERAIVVFEVPLRGIVANFYDKVKSASQGYASMNYKILGYKQGNLVKLEIFIAGKKEEALSRITAEEDAYEDGKKLVEKLKDTLFSQQFTVALQAAVGGKIVARETISARRKDVTGYLYGGDVTRKKKLLEKQKKGKKLLKEKGRINISSKTFLEIFRA